MLEPYIRISQAAGISLFIGQDGDYRIAACSLSAKGNALDFEQKLTEVTSLEALKKGLPANLPVALNLSGKGVLVKQVERQEEISSHNFSIVLPNASYEDFYVQHFVSGDRSFVALIRKVEADRWIERINALGFQCLSLSLSAFPTAHILSQLNEYGEELIFDGHRIKRDEQGHWLSYQYTLNNKAPFPIKLANEKIDERLLLPYAAAFQLLLSLRLEMIQAEVPKLSTALSEKLSTNKVKAWGGAVLGVFFILLLVNFVLFSYYNSANAKLTEEVSRTEQSTTDEQSVSEQIKQQEALLQQIGWESNAGKARMIDQVAQCLPPEVTWQQAGVDMPQPVTGQQSLSFESHTLRIMGSSPQITAVNEWLARLKAKPWVRQAQLESYNYNPESATGQFNLVFHY